MSYAVIFLDILCVMIEFYNGTQDGNLRKSKNSKKDDHLLIF